MGLSEHTPEKQQRILDIANTAIRLKEIRVDSIFEKTGVPLEESMQMEFSTFVNSYIRKYHPESKVRMFEFLRDLQKIIINENESLIV